MDEVVEVWGERGKGMDKVRQGDVVTGKHLADVEGTRGCWNWNLKEGNEWESTYIVIPFMSLKMLWFGWSQARTFGQLSGMHGGDCWGRVKSDRKSVV